MKVLTLLFSLYSLNALATVYTGSVKGKNESCQLKIENIYYDGTEDKKNLRINVEVSFHDGHHAHHGDEELEIHQITLQPSPLANLYFGFGANEQDKLNVGSSSLSEFIPNMYSFRWIHGTHFHNIQCLNLIQN